ncbi:MAG: hypothetical protein HND57_06220 [Planctomycetes bacterium]|nr:hypothetical protein [Planctomycetota bacterium]
MSRMAVAAPLLLLLMASSAAGQSTEPAVFITTYPNATQGKITSFTMADDGMLTLVGVYDTSDTGAQTISLAPDGRHLAMAHGTANGQVEQLDIFAINSDATLSFVLTELVPDSPLDVAWLRSDLLAVVQTDFPSTVGIYAFDEVNATLIEIDREDSGSFSSNVISHPHGRYVFVNDSSGNKVSAFEVSDVDGTITPTAASATSGMYPLGMGTTSTGGRLYVGGGISGGGDKVHGYAVSFDDGSLTALPGSPYTSPGDSPKLAVATPDDRYLFVGHGSDATVRSFRIESDGSITSLGRSFDIGLQGTLGDIAMLDDYMLVTDNSSAVDGKSGVYVFRVNSDGSFSMVGSDLFDTQTSTPNTMAVWNPETGMYLDSSPLIGGTQARFEVTGAGNAQDTALVYSLAGPGRTPLYGQGITLGLLLPIELISVKTSDATGFVAWNRTIPSKASGRTVWMQAAQAGRVSNVIGRSVQ